MKRVLFVGQDPATVDFSDPALPPGFDAKKIQAGIDAGIAGIKARGWDGVPCMIAPNDKGIAVLEKTLAHDEYDCVVIGAGMRLPPKGLVFFEKVLNAIHDAVPETPIAFNTKPEDTADAAARWLED
jgi:hypothetical protein